MDNERLKALKVLSGMLGHKFNDIGLLSSALTHGSYANENPDLVSGDNERLEFLGDAVLQLCISDRLIRKFPDYTEGQLSKTRASMVNDQSLAGLARQKMVGDFLLLGRGEENADGRNKDSILADAFEAIIGVIYIDGGYETAKSFIKQTFAPLIDRWLEQPVLRDYKSLLQELSQRRFKLMPRYQMLKAYGPDHDKTFEISVGIGDSIDTTGSGKSKKEAEQDAARKALHVLKKT